MIMSVLDRDAALQQKEQLRVAELKNQMREMRLKNVIRVKNGNTQDASQSCALCRLKFGWLFNKPKICVQCSHRVCAKCCQKLANNRWLCLFCIKKMELEAMTGQWFLALCIKNKRVRRTDVCSAELIRASIRHARQATPPTIANGQCDPVSEDVVDASPAAPSTSSPVPSVSIAGPDADGTTGYSASDRASIDAISDADETEDIGEMFATYGGSGPRKAHSHTNLTRLSPFSSSKESIVSVYSSAGEGNYGKYPVSGEIEFSLAFNYKQGYLEVYIRQCRGLAVVDTKRNSSDPYIKTYLLPDKTKNGKRKTRAKKHTLNPIFNEIIKYHVTKSELESRTLCIMVWNSDRFGRNDFLGEVNVSFDHHTFDDPTPKWHKLQDRNLSPLSMLTYKGDLNLCLKYASPEHLNAKRLAAGGGMASTRGFSTSGGELLVLVKQARNLTAVRTNGFSDPFCKCFLLPDRTRGGTQKSPVVKRNCNPSWNYTFVFEGVTWAELRERSVELTIWDHDRLVSNDFLGGVRLNLGTGRSEGESVDWMDSKGEEVSLWQAMLDRPNCWIEGTLLLRPHINTRK